MRVGQSIWTEREGWRTASADECIRNAQLVFVFGARHAMARAELIAEIQARSPNAVLMGCSTAGEICGAHVYDDSIIATAVVFDKTDVRSAWVSISATSSHTAGRTLGEQLAAPNLSHVFVLSEGLNVNGSALVAGLREGLPPGVQITGGLSADGPAFGTTGVLIGGALHSDAVCGVGLYGSALRVGYGSMGGWDPFGPYRVITRSEGNVLYEFDGRSALELYKKYLGDFSKDLPSSGLLFPLLVRRTERDPGFVRTILSVDEASQSLRFAGDVPQGSIAQLMRANFDRLVDGASGAATVSKLAMGRNSAQLGLLISCVGRKLVLQQRIEEEVEAVRDVLGADTPMAGFYSYGEISPLTPGARCDLHNQTMTITILSEA